MFGRCLANKMANVWPMFDRCLANKMLVRVKRPHPCTLRPLASFRRTVAGFQSTVVG